MTEEQKVFLVRNALLAAGQELGDGTNGDHWPVVKDTIYRLMQDWENLKIERNVDAELKIHLYAQLAEMEAGLVECTTEMRAQLEPKIKELREVCDAYFCDLDRNAVEYDAEDAPDHIQRMKSLLSTLSTTEE